MLLHWHAALALILAGVLGNGRNTNTMTILFRWLFRQCLLRASGTLIIVLGIFVIIELFDKSRLLGHGMSAAILTEYLLLKIPLMIATMMPVILLLGISIYLIELSHHNEIAAMRAAGIGLGRLLQPILSVALCGAMLSFCIGEWVTPITNQRLDTIERVNVHHRAATTRNLQWIRDGQRMLRLQPLGDQNFAVMVLEVDADGRWLKRMDASKAVYEEGQWKLQNVYVSYPDAREGMQLQHIEQISFASSTGPDAADPPKPSHMRFTQLAEYVSLLQQAGMNSSDYQFSLHRKIAAPLACLIMALLAVGLCMNMGSRLAARSLGLITSIVFGLLFYVLGNASGMLSGGERLPPAFAAWLPTLFFGGISGFILMHREGV